MAFMYFKEHTSNKTGGLKPHPLKGKTDHKPARRSTIQLVEENGGRTGRDGRGQRHHCTMAQ